MNAFTFIKKYLETQEDKKEFIEYYEKHKSQGETSFVFKNKLISINSNNTINIKNYQASHP